MKLVPIQDKIISFAKDMGIAMREDKIPGTSTMRLLTEEDYELQEIQKLGYGLIDAGLAVLAKDEGSSLPKLFLLSPISGDMLKYGLEVEL